MERIIEIKLLVIITMVCFVCSSCEKTIPFEGENVTPKLVLNSYFTADSTLSVHLSNSLGVVQKGDLNDIVDANVSLYDANSQLVTTLVHDVDGVYKTSFQPSAGELYTIRASANGYKEVSASDQLLSRPDSLVLDASVDVSGDIVVNVTLTGNTSESNNYILNIQPDNFSFFEERIYFEVSGLILDNESDSESDNGFSLYQEVFFTDKLNADGKLVFTIKISRYENRGRSISNLNFNLTSCSSNFYRYYRSLKLYNYSDSGPFTEPVRVFSNVENGFGIFAGYNKVVSRFGL